MAKMTAAQVEALRKAKDERFIVARNASSPVAVHKAEVTYNKAREAWMAAKERLAQGK